MASSSSYTGPALATALGPPPSQKLTRANFLFWKTLVHPALRGAQVLNLLDGTDTAPATHLEVEENDGKKKKIPNPDYASWVSRDSTVLGWILNSLSPKILAHTIGVDSTAAVWATITKVCGSSSRSKINQLRGALGSTKKLELTASAFFAKMKGFASELAAAGKPVPEDEMIGYIVNGLDGSYNSLRQWICSLKLDRTRGLPPPPMLPCAVVRRLGADAHARQIVVTAVTAVITVTVGANNAMIAVVMMALSIVMVDRDGKSVAPCVVMMALCGVTMATLNVAVTMVANVAAGMVVLPPRSWTSRAKSARSMDILPPIAGGDTRMMIPMMRMTLDVNAPHTTVEDHAFEDDHSDENLSDENLSENGEPMSENSANSSAVEEDNAGSGSEADSPAVPTPDGADPGEDSPAQPASDAVAEQQLPPRASAPLRVYTRRRSPSRGPPATNAASAPSMPHRQAPRSPSPPGRTGSTPEDPLLHAGGSIDPEEDPRQPSGSSVAPAAVAVPALGKNLVLLLML
ncbi:hypothetical protein QYE76_016332 [Lolium multiflorum]|uniref:Uncharacterized protein n=1 Tax=Lolium multiflorum TaxID=4521 RepID=A0AAD8QHJ5_LOLMU|nr:hypothetical protein QYE76_016332 [Lolium multiflorum]